MKPQDAAGRGVYVWPSIAQEFAMLVGCTCSPGAMYHQTWCAKSLVYDAIRAIEEPS